MRYRYSMTLPISRASFGSTPRPLRISMQTRRPHEEMHITPPIKQSYRFPYFIKGVPPHWKNPPPSVKLFRPFDDLKFRLKLRMLDKQRKNLPIK